MKATQILGFVGMAAIAGAATGCSVGSGGAMAPEPMSPVVVAPAASAAPAAEGSVAPAQPGARGRVSVDKAPRKFDREESEAPSAAERPGLGTEWGETRVSRISTIPFERADASSPFATASLFYNDDEGARSMVSAAGFRATSGGLYPIAGGAASIGLRDEHGNFFRGFVAGGRSYSVGEAGRRYAIVVRNNTASRLEVVLSVDGLDVIDGRSASFWKRGYLIDAHDSVEVDGFRQSTETVASFRFGSVRGSYASQKTGDTRNVGVIGVALFHERGTHPFPWTPEEVQRRRDANPFPGQFATPPGY